MAPRIPVPSWLDDALEGNIGGIQDALDALSHTFEALARWILLAGAVLLRLPGGSATTTLYAPSALGGHRHGGQFAQRRS